MSAKPVEAFDHSYREEMPIVGLDGASLLFDNDPHVRRLYTTARFKHLCDRGERGVVVCAPALSPEHEITWHGYAESVSVTPSILCPDCGLHGFVTDGRWSQ